MTRFSAILLFWALPYGAAAHDIPSDVTVHVFLKPAGDNADGSRFKAEQSHGLLPA